VQKARICLRTIWLLLTIGLAGSGGACSSTDPDPVELQKSNQTGKEVSKARHQEIKQNLEQGKSALQKSSSSKQDNR
jgi:hypothetical protein